MTPRPDSSSLSLFQPPESAKPLAARMRPRSIDEVAGQTHLLGEGRALRVAIESGTPGSMIFWGPPGSGKTTLALLIAEYTERAFVPFSAVIEGVPRVREIIAEAERRLAEHQRGTILFVDEIHRLNTAQQDAFLPHVEKGTITLIGATTENPSFEVNPALLSRVRVFVLQPIEPDDVARILRAALADEQRGIAKLQLDVTEDAIAAMAESADGDARRALTVLEAAGQHVGTRGRIDAETVREVMQYRVMRYDKGREEHYNMLSAYHKSLRGSDPQGALYWMARMLEGGEDPMTIFRRALAMAAEDIGLADPQALQLAVAARDAYHMLGAPEGYLPLAEMTIYLATAPKSVSSKAALGAAMEAARKTPSAPVPLHIRNAPTSLMKELGYGKGYQYAHDAAEAYIPQDYLPDELRGSVLYEPGKFGFEREIAKRLAWWAELRRKSGQSGEDQSAERGNDDA